MIDFSEFIVIFHEIVEKVYLLYLPICEKITSNCKHTFVEVAGFRKIFREINFFSNNIIQKNYENRFHVKLNGSTI